MVVMFSITFMQCFLAPADRWVEDSIKPVNPSWWQACIITTATTWYNINNDY